MSDNNLFNKKFAHAQYSMGFAVSREQMEAERQHWASRIPSLGPGRRWFGRMACRRSGHLPPIEGECPRCGLMTVPPLEYAMLKYTQSAKLQDEQLIRQIYENGGSSK